jgi:Rrf2 family protein
MIYSRSTQYAIRAMAFLATTESGEYVRARDIACSTGVPLPFLFKITQALARSGLVQTMRGRCGGICLTRPARRITLEEIVVSVHGDDFSDKCLLGLPHCNDAVPCPVHHAWKDLRMKMSSALNNRTLEDLALSLTSKERRPARRKGDSRSSRLRTRDRKASAPST